MYIYITVKFNGLEEERRTQDINYTQLGHYHNTFPLNTRCFIINKGMVAISSLTDPLKFADLIRPLDSTEHTFLVLGAELASTKPQLNRWIEGHSTW